MNNIDSFLNAQAPTTMRPLLGQTVLLVEDSLTSCEAIRLMCLRSGARIRRADCIESAQRHLRIYRPTIVMVDMGLPDGNGATLISEIHTSDQRIEVILGISGDVSVKQAAIDAGADGFIEKPIQSIAAFQAQIINYLPDNVRPMGPRKACSETVKPDQIALQEDLAHALNLLEDGDPTPVTHKYLATFLSGVARTASDGELETMTRAFAHAKSMAGPEKQRLSGVLIDRLAHRANV